MKKYTKKQIVACVLLIRLEDFKDIKCFVLYKPQFQGLFKVSEWRCSCARYCEAISSSWVN